MTKEDQMANTEADTDQSVAPAPEIVVEKTAKKKTTGLNTDMDIATYWQLETGVQLAIIMTRSKRARYPKRIERQVLAEGVGFKVIADVTKVANITINASGITIDPAGVGEKSYRPPQEVMAKQIGFDSQADAITWAASIGKTEFTALYVQNVRQAEAKS